MAKVVKVFKVLRNNWKKTTVAVALLSYGIDYADTEFMYTFHDFYSLFAVLVVTNHIVLTLQEKIAGEEVLPRSCEVWRRSSGCC